MFCRMPFMLVGTGPFGSGMFDRLASSALSRLRMSVISAGLTWRPSFWTCLTSFGSGTSPSPFPQTTSWIGVSAATRSCLRRSEVSSARRRCGLPSPTRTMPGGPTTRCTTSCCLLNAITGSDFQPRRSIRSAAAAAPGCPSICVYAAFWARRPNTIIASSVPSSSAPTTEMMTPSTPLVGRSSQKTTKPITRPTTSEPKTHRPRRGSDRLAIR